MRRVAPTENPEKRRRLPGRDSGLSLKESDVAKRQFDPAHPGVVLAEDFLKAMEISQYRLAKGIAVPSRRSRARETEGQAFVAHPPIKSNYFVVHRSRALTTLPEAGNTRAAYPRVTGCERQGVRPRCCDDQPVRRIAMKRVRQRIEGEHDVHVERDHRDDLVVRRARASRRRAAAAPGAVYGAASALPTG